jgi:hypothetical protein
MASYDALEQNPLRNLVLEGRLKDVFDHQPSLAGLDSFVKPIQD